MMAAKKHFICLLLILMAGTARADHITGGEMFYTLVNATNGEYTYSITLKLFMVCNSVREFNNPTYVSFFDKATDARVRDVVVPLGSTETISLTAGGPCITNPPVVCYRVGYYSFTVTLPASSDGYTLASQVIYRVDNMENLVLGYDQVGASYTAEIPGTRQAANGPENNSARFTGSDLVVICANNYFTYSFAATDTDGDKLSYSFCGAYQESTGDFGNNVQPPGPPPYATLPYGRGFTASSPLGNNVSIDANTGLITGLAPAVGVYVVTVCVQEIRNNQVIAVQRKDIQINITSCSLAEATIMPEYKLCGADRTINISNLSVSPLIQTTHWQFFNSTGQTIFDSNEKLASYTFPDTGIYTIRLAINEGQECGDTALASVKVYPGFVAGFIADSVCKNNPVQFSDNTSSVYGQVNYWRWDFGDIEPDDSSSVQHPQYKYGTVGLKTVQLIVADSKGCRDTVIKTVDVFDKPPITLAFRDTLICLTDSLQLRASGTGVFSWQPVAFMANENTASPKVSPPATTIYHVELNNDGCVNTDSVTVNVVDHVTLATPNDTVICSGDTIRLNIISDALQYSWSPSEQLINASEKNPQAITGTTTGYHVTAIIGSCSAEANIQVTTVPYPLAVVGNDTSICHQSAAQLHAFTDGSSFTWTPPTSLQNGNTLNPLAWLSKTTSYIFTAYDTKGCPKPGKDTVTITVLPDIIPFAGRDTAVVIGQPLQLHATGGTGYQWLPATGLSATNIANPIASYHQPSEGIYYKVLVYNEAGCADSAGFTVKVFTTLPSVFVPTAFTPNRDGLNDVLKPLAVGMQHMEFFNIYNRWGELVFTTKTSGKGWDGTIAGKPQNAGVYVWMVKAVDYTGAPYLQKGTVTLIR